MNNIVYIAGPITKNPNYKEDFNNKEKELQEKGYIVLNPSVLPIGLKQEDYMKICIPMLNIADTIYMLKNWKDSVGANIENALAKQAQKTILYEE